jgi:hypothetical protein
VLSFCGEKARGKKVPDHPLSTSLIKGKRMRGKEGGQELRACGGWKKRSTKKEKREGERGRKKKRSK